MKLNSTWTLHIENFARIESADIEIAPLMCFIGDNNSGKSYVMSLLWGILTQSDLLYNNQPKETETYSECKEWILNHIDKRIVALDSNDEQMYLRWFNELLEQNKDALIRRIFNTTMIQIGNLKITNFKRKKKLSVKIKSADKLIVSASKLLLGKSNRDKIEIAIPTDKKKFESGWWKASLFIAWNLLMTNLTEVVPVDKSVSGSVYLPASRTGFLLARRDIARKSIDMTYSLDNNENITRETLTAPYIQFLQIFNSIPDTPKIFNDPIKAPLHKFLKENIIYGNISSKLDGQIIRYTPNDLEGQEFPMSISSSVVTEIAPLLLVLIARINFASLIIEEPEAHLHPALQKKIAQLIIRFVHNDIPVWITTHSDTILQHFNNMIKLNNRSIAERDTLLKQFNYTSEDLLNIKEIALYQFNRQEHKTVIQKLQSGKYGFVVPTFNNSIEELLEEVFAFQGED